MGYADYEEYEPEELTEPQQYRVVLLDNDHSFPPLIDGILANIFNFDLDDLFRLGDELKQKGRVTVGIFEWDIAMSKARDALKLANQYAYNLKCMLIDEDGSSHKVTYIAAKDANDDNQAFGPNTLKYNTY
jgi:ATP-dependent Clp protease adaptor protein ClpS